MSQIPNFSLGSMNSPSNQQPQQNMPPNMIFPQQHLLPQHQQQRAQQTSPPQPQGIPGVPDPENQRMWQVLDRQVRANPSDPSQVNFTQMAQYFRNSGLHPQQGNLQGFSQQIQHHNVNANQSHHVMNSNINQTSLNTTPSQPSPAQLQNLDPAFRQLFQQQQQQLRQQQVQQQQQQQQQQQNAGNMNAPYPVDLGFPPSASHPVNTSVTADLARQYDLMSRAGQNQGQNGSSMGLNQVNPSLARPGQMQGLPNQSAMGQQGISFQQSHNVQVPPNMVTHQSMVSHQNPAAIAAAAARQVHVNHQAYPSGNSIDASNNGAAVSNASGNVLNNPLTSRVPVPNSIQATAAGVTAMNDANQHIRRHEIQLAAFRQDLINREKTLRETGWSPGMTSMTDQQRQLATEYEQRRNVFIRHINSLNSAAQMSSQVNMHTNGTNGQSAGNNHLVHGWLPGQSSKQPNVPPNLNHQQVTPRIAGGGSVPQQASISGSSTSSFPQQSAMQQQPQTIFTPMQPQQSLPVPRTASAQSMNNVMQQVQQQQQQRSTTGPVSGQMFELQQGQTANGQGLRPPTVPPQSGTTSASQTNPVPVRTPMQGQGQASIPSNVPPRPSPSGANSNLRKATFDESLKNVLDRQGITIDSRDRFIDTREVQLHELFMEVMKRGGLNVVARDNLWPIIGASLGFVQFPAAGSEPARSSPNIAEHLRYLYQKYLLHYEQLHVNHLNQEQRRLAIQAQATQNSLQPAQQHLAAQQQQSGQRHPNTGFPFVQNPAMVMQARQHQSADAQVQQQRAVQNLPPQHAMHAPFQGTQPGQVPPHLNMRMNTYPQFANMSVEELRKLGIPENNIALIEQNRAALQKQLQQQQMMQMMQQSGQAQMQQSQMPQMNFPVSQMQNIRSNLPGSAGGTGEASQMHPGNMMQLPQQLQPNSQNQSAHQQMPSTMPQGFTRLTQAQLTSARDFVRRAMAEQAKSKRTYQYHNVRDVERSAYALAFKQFFEFAIQMEKKLVLFHAVLQDAHGLQRLLNIVAIAKEQSKLMASNPNQSILPLQTVNALTNELRMMFDRFQQASQKISLQQAPSAPATELPPANPPPSNPTSLPPPQAPNETNNLPPVPQALQNTAQPQVQADVARAQPVQQPPQQNLQVPVQTQSISKSKRTPTGGAANTPSPAAPTTPFNNAPTPPASSSPRTPKSPPKKPSQPPANAASVPVSKPKPTQLKMNRRSSKAGQVPVVALPTAPAVEEVKTGATGKRLREDEPAGSRPASQVEPVAKKPKREDWDGPINEEIEKRHQEINNFETNQDVQNFLARTVDELVGDTSTANHGDIPKALQDFLNSAPTFGITDSFMSTAYVDPTKFGDLSPSVENGVDVIFDSFFDFSKCAPDDPIPSNSKLDPPDLLQSSANPSPESAAETPKHENASINGKHRDNAIKIVDDSTMHNPLEHTLWTEINNGEPAYYEHTNFKFDGELPPRGSPWAISGGA